MTFFFCLFPKLTYCRSELFTTSPLLIYFSKSKELYVYFNLFIFVSYFKFSETFSKVSRNLRGDHLSADTCIIAATYSLSRPQAARAQGQNASPATRATNTQHVRRTPLSRVCGPPHGCTEYSCCCYTIAAVGATDAQARGGGGGRGGRGRDEKRGKE